jgi:hypothetical protein
MPGYPLTAHPLKPEITAQNLAETRHPVNEKLNLRSLLKASCPTLIGVLHRLSVGESIVCF